MSSQAENNQWYKERTKILDEFSGSHRTLMSTIASRNFSRMPGFLYEASIMLEEAGKNKLSALNYQIVAEAIERELKQTGHDYTEAYKTARIAFELSKQTLLTALQQEFSDLDATQSLKKEELDRLFVEMDIRKIILITTKATIDLEMEALKQELVDTDRLTFDNETLLINEKIATATAKLDVIPYIETIISAQERLLTAEENNISHMENLIDEKELLINKKKEIVPYLVDKAAEQLLLAEAILAAIEIEKGRLDVALSKAELQMDAVGNTLDIIAAEKTIETLRVLLYSARHDLQITKINRQVSLTDSNSTNIGAISAGRTGMMAILEGYKVAIASSIRNARKAVSETDLAGDKESTDISINAEDIAIRAIATYQASATTQTALAAATAKITSELIHLIGS